MNYAFNQWTYSYEKHWLLLQQHLAPPDLPSSQHAQPLPLHLGHLVVRDPAAHPVARPVLLLAVPAAVADRKAPAAVLQPFTAATLGATSHAYHAVK